MRNVKNIILWVGLLCAVVYQWRLNRSLSSRLEGVEERVGQVSTVTKVERETIRQYSVEKSVAPNAVIATEVGAALAPTVSPTSVPFKYTKDVIESWNRDFALYDSNKDGRIDPQEANLTAGEFSYYDLDGDGQIEPWEGRMLARLLSQTEEAGVERNKTKKGFPISADDFTGSQKRFSFIDQDHDAQLSETEYLQFLARGRLEVRRLDLNGDGDISLEEFGQGKTRFDFLDDDKDGLLDASEIRSGMVQGKW